MARRIGTTLALTTAAFALGLAALAACGNDDPAAGDDNSSSSSSGASGNDPGSSGSNPGNSGDDDADKGNGDAAPNSDAGSDGGNGGAQWVGPDGGIASTMNFFVTSTGPGKGGDLRAKNDDTDGLAGADAFCTSLANAVDPALGAKAWKAYLSTANVNARDRIPEGPYFNAKGVLIANDKAHLHDEMGNNLLAEATNLDELGKTVPLSPNVHDILTGTNANGQKSADTCSNWTSASGNVKGNVGHANRSGGGAAPTSWNAAHATNGCAESGTKSVRSGGGRGSFYCFAN